MIQDKEVAIVNATSKALDLVKKDPYMPIEEIIQKVMRLVDAGPDVKIKAIAAVNEVVKMKRQLNNLTDKQIIQEYITNFKKQNDEEILEEN